ncbi:alpha/beta hydrolase family protein [Pedobacter aquatilis]|uniref:alpha/beta hydrolase family protein n=1 Tax=Pedobacter aquatilis TaxID=351343 RepID=UPI00292E2D8E|nr:alpha/beta hydrolase [Pedobacter aquatilis]
MKKLILITLTILGLLFQLSKSATAQQKSYTIQNIKFENAGITLSGSLFLPKKPKAALVLIHGSGQEKRMTKFAIDLANQDIAVFTYDKRGVGESGGKYAGPEVGTNNIDSANLELLSDDAATACKTLAQQLPNGKLPLGLMGVSQAGWIIPMAAAKTNLVKFMVIYSGPVVTTLEQLRFQFYTNGDVKFWESHNEADALEHIHNDADRYQFTTTDPMKTLAKLNIKGLWIFGAQDIQIPVALCVNNLKMLQAQGKPYEYFIYPELGHNTAFLKSTSTIDKAISWIKKNYR